MRFESPSSESRESRSQVALAYDAACEFADSEPGLSAMYLRLAWETALAGFHGGGASWNLAGLAAKARQAARLDLEGQNAAREVHEKTGPACHWTPHLATTWQARDMERLLRYYGPPGIEGRRFRPAALRAGHRVTLDLGVVLQRALRHLDRGRLRASLFYGRLLAEAVAWRQLSGLQQGYLPRKQTLKTLLDQLRQNGGDDLRVSGWLQDIQGQANTAVHPGGTMDEARVRRALEAALGSPPAWAAPSFMCLTSDLIVEELAEAKASSDLAQRWLEAAERGGGVAPHLYRGAAAVLGESERPVPAVPGLPLAEEILTLQVAVARWYVRL